MKNIILELDIEEYHLTFFNNSKKQLSLKVENKSSNFFDRIVRIKKEGRIWQFKYSTVKQWVNFTNRISLKALEIFERKQKLEKLLS